MPNEQNDFRPLPDQLAGGDTMLLTPEKFLQRNRLRYLLRGTGACLCSMLVHVLILLLLGILVIPIASQAPIEAILSEVIPEELEKDDLKMELDLDRNPVEEMDLSLIHI